MPRLTAIFSADFLGGSELFNLEFLRCARERTGVRIDAVVPAEGALSRELAGLADRVEVVPLPEALTMLSRFDRRLAVRSLTRQAPALAGYVRRLRRVVGDADWPVCCLGFRSQLAYALAGIGVRRPLAWIVHEVVPATGFGRAWRHAASRADLVLAYSRTAAEQPLLSKAKVHVHRIVLDLDAYESLPPPRFPPRVLGLIGDLVPLKNHGALIDVVERLRASDHDVEALIVGRDLTHALPATAPYVSALLERVKRLDGHVRLVGATPDDVPGMVAEMDVLLHLTSVPETFGRVIAEAMAAGRPAVAFDHGAAAELVVDGGTGSLCPLGDIAAVAGSVAAMRADRERFEQLSRAACHAAMERHGRSSPADTLGDALAEFVTAGR
jgi:glycosyltransferase involved in cell wall biosynthesis